MDHLIHAARLGSVMKRTHARKRARHAPTYWRAGPNAIAVVSECAAINCPLRLSASPPERCVALARAWQRARENCPKARRRVRWGKPVASLLAALLICESPARKATARAVRSVVRRLVDLRSVKVQRRVKRRRPNLRFSSENRAELEPHPDHELDCTVGDSSGPVRYRSHNRRRYLLIHSLKSIQCAALPH